MTNFSEISLETPGPEGGEFHDVVGSSSWGSDGEVFARPRATELVHVTRVSGHLGGQPVRRYVRGKNITVAPKKSKEFDPYDTTGKCPAPLKSSWMMNFRQIPPDRPNITRYELVDNFGNCMTTCKTEESAKETQAALKKLGHRLAINPVTDTEQSRQEESAIGRQYRREGHLSRG